MFLISTRLLPPVWPLTALSLRGFLVSTLSLLTPNERGAEQRDCLHCCQCHSPLSKNYLLQQFFFFSCSTSKHNITNTLLCKSEFSPLPSTIHPSHLPLAFSDFFANQIDTIRHSLDIDSTSLPTCNDPQFLGQPLAAFHLVSDATVKVIIRQSSLKTCELDPLPASFFSQCLDTLLPYITTVVNNSLASVSSNLLS